MSHPNIRIFLCCYNQESLDIATKYAEKYSFFKVHFLKQSVYLENELLFYLRDNPQEWEGFEWVGMLASTFQRKIPLLNFSAICEKYSDMDFIPFRTDGEDLEKLCKKCHTNLKEILKLTLSKFQMDTSVLNKIVTTVFFNYWVMKKPMLSTYLKFISDVRNYWDNDIAIRGLLYENARYSVGTLTKEQTKAKFGVPYYPHHTFVLERLVGIFASNYGYKWARSNGPDSRGTLSAFKIADATPLSNATIITMSVLIPISVIFIIVAAIYISKAQQIKLKR